MRCSLPAFFPPRPRAASAPPCSAAPWLWGPAGRLRGPVLSPYLYVAPSDLVSPTLAGEAGDRLRGLRLWVLRSLALGGPVGMLRSTAQQSEAPEAQVELIEEVLELRHLQSKRELERERERKKKKRWDEPTAHVAACVSSCCSTSPHAKTVKILHKGVALE